MIQPPAPRAFMLSFDDGPLPGKTEVVLATLRRFTAEDGLPVRAGFFMVGDAPQGFWAGRRYFAPYEVWIHKGSMRRHPHLVAQVQAQGHVIGNHTARHIWARWPRYGQLPAVLDELRDWARHAEFAGWQAAQSPRLFRAPYLLHTPVMHAAATQLGYQIVGGAGVGDANPRNDLAALRRQIHSIFKADSNQPVMLIFHDILPITVRYLGDIIDGLLREGHQLRHFDP
ncbi:MAG TPA: polysaccharide deacetylase family protein [Halothiobacillus sp.]|nr:polysaccharide deacetylase family protein [Halothiobacillus sp.]